MAIQIEDNVSSIKITNGSVIRNIVKSRIIEISIIKTNILKIDIGMGALRNIFIPYLQVTQPVAGSPDTLANTINDWLMLTGMATELRQVAETSNTQAIINYTLLNLNALQTLNDKTFDEPLIVDTRSASLTYKGYSFLGTQPDEPYWAIQRIQKIGTTDVAKWVNGGKDLNCVWNDRDTYQYY